MRVVLMSMLFNMCGMHARTPHTAHTHIHARSNTIYIFVKLKK